MWPVFIPSKGRAGRTAVTRLLRAADIPCYVMVEPSEERAYAEHLAHPSELLVQPRNNETISHARQYVLEYARAMEFGWYWLFDDDLNGFYKTIEVEPGKWRVRKADIRFVLEQAEEAIESSGPNTALAHLVAQQLSWCWDGEPVRMNRSTALTCVAVHAERTQPLNYDTTLPFMEDLDFTLAVLESGKDVAACTRLCFSAPRMGSHLGGCYDIHHDLEAIERSVNRVHEKYPDVTRVIDWRGQADIRTRWAAYQRSGKD